MNLADIINSKIHNKNSKERNGMKNNVFKVITAFTIATSTVAPFTLLDKVEAATVSTSKAQSVKQFKDVKSNAPYYKELLELRKRGIMSGYGNDIYKPDELVTRKTVAVGLAKVLKITQAEAEKRSSVYNLFFEDPYQTVFIDDLSPKNIEQLKSILGEKEFNRRYKPKTPYINKQDLANIFFNIMSKDINESFKPINLLDVDKDDVYYNMINIVDKNGIFKLKPNSNFDPEKTLTRGEFAVYLYRLLENKESQPSWYQDLTGDIEKELKKSKVQPNSKKR